jgi:hypothetical protein
MKEHKNKLDKNTVIEQFNNIHNSLYNYSKMNYVNDRTNITIICPTHGEFEQTPSNHKNGQKCPKCQGKNLTLNEIKEKLNYIHFNKYNYEKFNSHIKSSEKITIICSEHGEFEQTLNNHMRGQGCKKCAGLEKPLTNELIKIFNNIHGDKYDYSLIDYKNAHSKIKIICSKHGIFEQTPNNHKNGNGCPICCESKGELEIRKFLEANKIYYVSQYKFPDCKNKLGLPFDFYLPDYNICIEFNGIQHYKAITHFGGDDNLIKIKDRDKIKKEYCFKNNIPLIIIKYNDNIISKLNNITL